MWQRTLGARTPNTWATTVMDDSNGIPASFRTDPRAAGASKGRHGAGSVTCTVLVADDDRAIRANRRVVRWSPRDTASWGRRRRAGADPRPPGCPETRRRGSGATTPSAPSRPHSRASAPRPVLLGNRQAVHPSGRAPGSSAISRSGGLVQAVIESRLSSRRRKSATAVSCARDQMRVELRGHGLVARSSSATSTVRAMAVSAATGPRGRRGRCRGAARTACGGHRAGDPRP